MGSTSALRAAFETNNGWSEWCTLVVVVGLVVEFATLLAFSKEMSASERLLLILGNILIAGGVGGEYVFGSRAASAAAGLQQVADREVANLNSETERLRARNLALEKLTQPRRISPEYEMAIRADMQRCATQKFRLSIPAGDGEAALLAFQISAILRDAQWDEGDRMIEQRPPGGPLVIGVRVLPAVEEGGAETAYRLKDWLHIAGISSAILLDEPATPPDRLEIRIGVKPLPEMFEPRRPGEPESE